MTAIKGVSLFFTLTVVICHIVPAWCYFSLTTLEKASTSASRSKLSSPVGISRLGMISNPNLVPDPNSSLHTNQNALNLNTPTSRNLHISTDNSKTLLYYDQYTPPNPSNQAVLYLPCLSRAKNNAKASNLEMFAKRTNRHFVCADYFAVGRSKGRMEDACLTRW